MSLTGACHYVAAYAKGLVFFIAASLFASDCSVPALSVEEIQSRLNTLAAAAQNEVQHQQFSEAVQHLREAVCLAPKEAKLIYMLGVAEAASKDFLSARKHLNAVNTLQPGNPIPLAMLVRVNFSMGDIDSVKATLREAATRFPHDNNLHAMLAQFLVQNKLFDLALAESLRLRQADQNPPAEALMQLAVLENTVGAYEDAIRNAMFVEQQMNLPSAVRAAAAGVAGLSSQGAGRPEEAVSHLREAIQLDPTQENSYLSLAFLYEKTQKFGDAVGVLEQGRRECPQSTALLLPLGSNLVRVERYAEAVDVLKHLLQIDPDQYDAYLRIADACRQTGKSDQEVQILSDLAQRKPDYPMIHVLIASALLRIDPADYPRVLQELTMAEEHAPSDAQIFFLRAKVYLETNREEEARAALLRSIELAPLDPAPYYRLGQLLRKMGQPEQAKELLARVQLLNSNPSK